MEHHSYNMKCFALPVFDYAANVIQILKWYYKNRLKMW